MHIYIHNYSKYKCMQFKFSCTNPKRPRHSEKHPQLWHVWTWICTFHLKSRRYSPHSWFRFQCMGDGSGNLVAWRVHRLPSETFWDVYRCTCKLCLHNQQLCFSSNAMWGHVRAMWVQDSLNMLWSNCQRENNLLQIPCIFDSGKWGQQWFGEHYLQCKLSQTSIFTRTQLCRREDEEGISI